MDVATAKSIENYLNIVCADAAKAEQRENDVEYQFAELNGTVILAIRTKYLRMRRRILYRLANKFETNIHKPPCVMGMRPSEIPEVLRLPYDEYPGVDVNYSVVEWPIFGKPFTIRDHRRGPIHEYLLGEDKPVTEYLADLLDWQRSKTNDFDLDHPRLKTYAELYQAWQDIYHVDLKDHWNLSQTYTSSD